jgi:hypothetical protein
VAIHLHPELRKHVLQIQLLLVPAGVTSPLLVHSRGWLHAAHAVQEHLEDDDMGAECKSEVISDMHRMATDYRLNWRLNHACEADINKLCPTMCTPGRPCGGLVLQCLQEKQDNITNSDCQEEVFYYQLMEVSDFRNDVILAEACRTDVDSYCKEIEPGKLLRSANVTCATWLARVLVQQHLYDIVDIADSACTL